MHASRASSSPTRSSSSAAPDGRTILGDEVLTPDSSRFWSADGSEVGREQASFDKQFVRNWLNANWDRQGNPPHLPADVIEKTTEKYIQADEKLSGRNVQLRGGTRFTILNAPHCWHDEWCDSACRLRMGNASRCARVFFAPFMR